MRHYRYVFYQWHSSYLHVLIALSSFIPYILWNSLTLFLCVCVRVQEEQSRLQAQRETLQAVADGTTSAEDAARTLHETAGFAADGESAAAERSAKARHRSDVELQEC